VIPKVKNAALPAPCSFWQQLGRVKHDQSAAKKGLLKPPSGAIIKLL
jgi:hypothetical protein